MYVPNYRHNKAEYFDEKSPKWWYCRAKLFCHIALTSQLQGGPLLSKFNRKGKDKDCFIGAIKSEFLRVLRIGRHSLKIDFSFILPKHTFG